MVILNMLLVPWDYPNLSNRSTTTSPFTIVFKAAGSSTYLYLAISPLDPNNVLQLRLRRL